MPPPPDLPGFYFDKEKKKYFKIQPNHVAPSGAKYSKSNVAREQQITKKRKIEDRHQKVLRRQTVLPAPILSHSLLGGSGLSREHGCLSNSSSVTHREVAILRGLRPVCRASHTMLKDVYDAHWAGDFMLVIHPHHVTKYSIAIEDRKRSFSTVEHLRSYNDSIVSSRMATLANTSFMLTCFDTPPNRNSNAILFPTDPSQSQTYAWRVLDSLLDGDVNESNDMLGFAGETSVSTVSAFGHTVSSISLDAEASGRAIEWMSPHTLAYTSCKVRQQRSSENKIMLWDVRSPTARAARIDRQKRTSGLSKPDFSGTNMIVTSNYDISWYDLRLLRADRPLLSIRHSSGGPRTYHSTHYGGMLAAVDEREEVQLYSWRTGRHVKTLTCGPMYQGEIKRNVRWYEGPNGPFLQACCNKDVLTWEMGN